MVEPIPPPPPIVGLDLGPAQEPTALAVLERVHPSPPEPAYNVRLLKRWPLGTAFKDIAADLARVLKMLRPSPLLVLDQTGVGRPFADLVATTLAREQAGCFPWRVTVTAGNEVSEVGYGQWNVPRKTLVSLLQVLLQCRRLHVASGLPEATVLLWELQAFRAKVTLTPQDAGEPWREGAHDDLVLAVALAAWFGEHIGRGWDGSFGVGASCIAQAPPGVFSDLPAGGW
jgi:hypothetical protein